jgi:hypothetical protein
MKNSDLRRTAMTSQRGWQVALAGVLLTLGGLARPAPVAAHCDSMDGPVVQAAQSALDAGEVAPVLAWVRPEDEAQIRQAFERTLKVRQLGDEARGLADLWFFETLVRVHREGEGAPYTGLKPAGYEPPAGIDAADRALETGAVDALAARLSAHVAGALRERYQRVNALRDYDPGDVEAGRRYVHAYVEYIHFVEKLHGLIHGDAEAHASGASQLDAH